MNIFESSAEALVNPVNCVGVMGKGLALQFRQAYPENFQAYAQVCARGEVRPGRVLVYETGLVQPRWIINFPTKRHWRDRSRLEDIEAGLVDLVRVVRELGIRSIAVPPLGCGLGGLDWGEVRPRIEAALGSLEGVEVQIYGPRLERGMKNYAGIGSRSTPPEVIRLMERIGGRLAELGWTLRTGGAPGADQAFERGARARGGAVEVYLPWPGFEGYRRGRVTLEEPDLRAFPIAAELHPAWARLSPGAQKLHARNCHQVLGRGLDDPVAMVVCWTPGGDLVGGTAQAMRLAQRLGVPVINLAVEGALERIAAIVRG